MKFSSAVDSLTKENLHLRFIVKIQILAVLLLALTVMFLHEQKPLVVERSARGLEIVKQSTATRTQEDIEQAIGLMLKARFDTGSKSPEIFLSTNQVELRIAEQKELESRQISQAIIVRKVTLAKDEAFVDFDRVLSVGDIRSALQTTVKIAFEEVDPNEINPYGLKLALAHVQKKGGEK